MEIRFSRRINRKRGWGYRFATRLDTDPNRLRRVRANDHILLTGTRLAPTPCYETVLDAVETDDAALEVTIDRESVLAEDEECAQCVGGLTYEVVIEVTPPDAIDCVNVHNAEGGTHSVQFDEVNEEPGIGSDDHLAEPGDEINAHLYNEYSDELEVQVEITQPDDGPIIRREAEGNRKRGETTDESDLPSPTVVLILGSGWTFDGGREEAGILTSSRPLLMRSGSDHCQTTTVDRSLRGI